MEAEREAERAAKKIVQNLMDKVGTSDPEDLREYLNLDEEVHQHFSQVASDMNNLAVTEIITKLVDKGYVEDDFRVAPYYDLKM